MSRVSKKVAKSDAGAVHEQSSCCVRLQNSEKIYKTAIYARLSSEDLNKNDSGTIENQIFLVKKYIETKPYLKLCETFVDNGQTGTNFDRESFRKLMEAVKRGKIDCIVVKDLSRFGRDYIETGNYFERVFPFLNVRFIAVNDGYDSHNPARNGDNLTIVLKNLINDIYAKDISKKVRSVYETKRKKGEYTGKFAPYGYMKSPESKHKLVVDEETAPIVRDIFQWKLDGMSDTAIVRKLDGLRILSPSNYYYFKGLFHKEKFSKKILWDKSNIRKLLSNPVYIGHMAQGKVKSRFDAGLKAERLTPDNWIIVENTHEPIIDAKIFYAVKDILEHRSEKYHELIKNIITNEERKNIFAGLVKCADCGKNLIRKELKSNNISCFSFRCPTYLNYLSNGCVKKSISENNLKKAVFTLIKQQIAVLSETEDRIKTINSSPKIKNRKQELCEEFQAAEKRLIKINSCKNSLYDDFKDGLLTKKEYNYTRKKYENDGNILSARLNEITAELEKYSDKAVNYNKFCGEATKLYADQRPRFFDTNVPLTGYELSREMLTAFVEKITIHSDKKIEVTFKYQDEFEQLHQYILESEETV